ncbi:MAG: hypothetical protein LBE57_04650 [Methanosarcinales archaeon]|jgi:hypothetical protein|nr:hypothetical protein [Methanosarcinales archaeon]
MGYECYEWHAIESKTEFVQFIRYFADLDLEGTFQYVTAVTEKQLECDKSEMLGKQNREWIFYGPFAQIRFVPA